MIALRKLAGLSTKNRLRKAAELLRGFEVEIRTSRPVDSYYLAGLCETLVRSDTADAVRERAVKLEERLRKAGLSLSGLLSPDFGRECGVICTIILTELGTALADWDLRVPGTELLDSGARRVLPVDLFLEDLRSPFNVGNIFRSAEAFGVRHIYLSPATPSPEQPRASRSSMGASLAVPWSVCSLPEACLAFGYSGDGTQVIALETGGTGIGSYSFPSGGLLLVGNEEWGLSEEALSRADVRLSIPMGGAKASLNVSVAAAITLQRWFESRQ
ncbi:TrmH family RNA methyltransferase [Marispirochaeta aestuarii]|uniref:TrmH family RNA methyltransferase n=1 Tax=Marispirochaeta aestuarii TaxID=1963862 RepID=UPI002ABE34B7|nr:TrmH family RNA methyltransferase [Marispirochaeta aestuarii]